MQRREFLPWFSRLAAVVLLVLGVVLHTAQVAANRPLATTEVQQLPSTGTHRSSWELEQPGSDSLQQLLKVLGTTRSSRRQILQQPAKKPEQQKQQTANVTGTSTLQPSTVVLNHKPPNARSGSSGTPVTFTTYRGNSSYSKEPLPVLFLLNGANVEAAQYSQLATLLAGRGYTFVGSDYYRSILPGAKITVRNGCPAGKALFTSAAMLQTWLDYVDLGGTPDTAALKQELPRRGIVLISHSFGGVVSIDIIEGACKVPPPPWNPFSTCEGFIPGLVALPASSSSTNCQDPLLPVAAVAEAGAKRNSSAGAAQPLPAAVAPLAKQPLIRGVVAWEGYQPEEVLLSPGSFLLYLGGQYNNKAGQGFLDTRVQACSCSGYARFPGMNHYGMNNYQGEGSHQITPCAIKASADPKDFSITRSKQEAALVAEAELIDVFIRAAGLRDGAAAQQLIRLQAGAGTAAVYTLATKGACF